MTGGETALMWNYFDRLCDWSTFFATSTSGGNVCDARWLLSTILRGDSYLYDFPGQRFDGFATVALLGNFTHDGQVLVTFCTGLFDSLWCFRANSDIVQVIAKVGGARQQDMGTIFKLAQNYSSGCSDQVLFPSQSPFINVSLGQRSDCPSGWYLPKTIDFDIFQHQNHNFVWCAVWCCRQS